MPPDDVACSSVVTAASEDQVQAAIASAAVSSEISDATRRAIEAVYRIDPLRSSDLLREILGPEVPDFESDPQQLEVEPLAAEVGVRLHMHGQQDVGTARPLATNPQRLAVLDAGPALQHLDPGALEEGADAAGEARDDAVLPAHGLRDVDLRRRDLDPEGGAVGEVPRMLEFAGGVDQRLGRDAADVQAGAAQPVALHQHRRDAELAGADGGDVAAGTAADHDDVKLFAHDVLSQ